MLQKNNNWSLILIFQTLAYTIPLLGLLVVILRGFTQTFVLFFYLQSYCINRILRKDVKYNIWDTYKFVEKYQDSLFVLFLDFTIFRGYRNGVNLFGTILETKPKVKYSTLGDLFKFYWFKSLMVMNAIISRVYIFIRTFITTLSPWHFELIELHKKYLVEYKNTEITFTDIYLKHSREKQSINKDLFVSFILQAPNGGITII